MKKYSLKRWVKIIITLIITLIVFIFCYKTLNWLDNIEKARAYSEGRYIEYYTSTGEIFYK